MSNTKEKSMVMDLNENPFESSKFSEYIAKLSKLRENGSSKIAALKDEIRDIKLNKQIDKEAKDKIIAKDRELIKQARKIQSDNKENVSAISREAIKESSEVGKKHYQECKANNDKIISNAKADYKNNLAKVIAEHNDRKKALIAKGHGNSKNEISDYKANLKAEGIYFTSKKNETRSKRDTIIEKARANTYDAYIQKYDYQTLVHDGHHQINEIVENKVKTYLYNFVFKDYFLRNALYFIIILFFIVCAIESAKQGSSLLSWPNIRSILGQSSTKLFFSLGVAGLILIAGTDLSIGRMTGMAASFACMILSSVKYTDNFGNIIYFGDVAVAPRIILAIVVCIVVCVLFSAIAGFFSAKFKMHPFITTLSTQLLIFGIMMVIFSNIPSFNMILDVKKSITGDNNINLIIYAVIATFIMWFIWNKTKFGKNMYAVGGNAEAASVSGISVFWITMGIFIMAGVFYGLGGFLEGARVGAANPSTAFGTELDAIAACVVGGISFSGGVGKVRGAVIGTIIFTGMTYCLTNLGFDVNIQYIFKGIIIMAAVCLDSLKYLKKK